MSDLRFAPDTLFLVAEEDWRLWEGDCKKGQKLTVDDLPPDREGELAAPSKTGAWLKRGGAAAAASDPQAAAAAAAGPSQDQRPRREQEHAPEEGPKGWGRPKKAKPQGMKAASQELVDIVHICNEAHRNGHGELVWLAYEGNTKTPWTVTSASTFIALSARGARILKNHFDEQFTEPGHWDLFLKGVLQQEEFQKILKCCYLYPAMGGYEAHVSSQMNTQVAEVRECWWPKQNRQEGTREFGSDDRALSRSMPWQQWKLKLFPYYQKKAWERDLCDVATLPLGEPCTWWTAACSIFDTFYIPDQTEQARGQSKKNKLDPSSQPGTGRSRSKSPTRQRKQKWGNQMDVETRKLGQDPDSSFGPIRISHEQVQRSPDEISDLKTSSAQRRRREIIANFERRFFTNNPSKAGRLKVQSELAARPPAMHRAF